MASSTADPSPSNHSPKPRRAAARHPSSPWSHVVRGDPEAAAPSSPLSPASIPPLEPSDRSSPDDTTPSSDAVHPAPTCDGPDQVGSDGKNAAGRDKKAAWISPSNGSVVRAPGPIEVMGRASWPTLSDSKRASPKLPSSDAVPSAANDGSTSPASGPVVSSAVQKSSISSQNPNYSKNHGRQRQVKRGGDGCASSSGAPANGSPAVTLPVQTLVEDNQTTPEPSPRDQPSKNTNNNHNNNNGDHGSRSSGFAQQQTHGGNDHNQGYGGNRRGNNSGNGTHHRGFGGRNGHMQHRGGPRLHPRPLAPPPVPPFIAPIQARPFGSPMGFPDMHSPLYYIPAHPPHEALRGMPLVAHVPPPPPPPIFYHVPDPSHLAILKQIDYYFSPDNLCKDIYLRQNMDVEGWVPVTLIANFNRVKQVTNNVQYILETVRFSTVVEVQGEKIRKRNDWMNWVLPKSDNVGAISPHSPATRHSDNLSTHFQSVGLEEGAPNPYNAETSTNTEVALSRSASGNINNCSQDLGHPGDGNEQVTGSSDSSRNRPMRSLSRSDTL